VHAEAVLRRCVAGGKPGIKLLAEPLDPEVPLVDKDDRLVTLPAAKRNNP